MPQEELSTSRPPLKDQWVAKIFQEMQGNYGSRFLNQWKTGQLDKDGADVGIKNTMATWARKLSGFSDMPEAIKSVLDNLPDDPPTLPGFVTLCRDAGRRLQEKALRIEHKMTAEEKERADKAAEAVKRNIDKQEKRDHKAWARRLKERHDAGEVLSLNQVQCYQIALSVDEEVVA